MKYKKKEMVPKIYNGANHTDVRGVLIFNNNFDAAAIKRVFVLENNNNLVVRAWQGHKIEQRWFSTIKGRFKIQLIAIVQSEKTDVKPDKIEFILDSDNFDVLHIPAGYLSSIQSIEEGSKLLVMADHYLGEIDDVYRFEADFFD